MASLHSERNIRARINKFERQTSTDEVNTPAIQPRAERPVIAPRPSMTRSSAIRSTTHEETITRTCVENDYEEIIDKVRAPVPPSTAPRPQMPKRPSVKSNDQLKPQPLIKPPPQLPTRPSLRRTRTLTSQDEDTVFNAPQLPLRRVHDSQLNGSNHSSTRENEYVDTPFSHPPSNLSRQLSSTNTVTRKPTIIRVPSKQEQESCDGFPPALPVQRPGPSASIKHKDSSNSVSHQALPPRPGVSTMPPRRPPDPKRTPGRPPPPRRESILRNSTLQPRHSNRQSRNSMSMKTPVLPPRPKTGHLLYKRYSQEIPPNVSEQDDNNMHVGQLQFQESTSLQASTDSAEKGTVQLQALYDFNPEGPGELELKAGDIINNAEQIDSEWYLGTSRGITGFFPINYVKPLSREPAPAPARVPARAPKPTPATLQKVSGPRCRARFDFEAEQSNELSFTEGQVIRLLEYMGEDWARGEVGTNVGFFPLNFVEILEDLPASPAKNHIRVPLPGMAATNNVQPAAAPTYNQACGVEQVKALYDFTAETDGDLSFLRGDVIEVIEHFSDDWSQGRLNGQEGLFPRSFTQKHTGGSSYR